MYLKTILLKNEVDEVVREWLNLGHSQIVLVTLFVGDRLSVIDESVAIKVDGKIVGIATIAPQGEMMSGVPTIVGIYVLPEFRRQGLGKILLLSAIERCQERGFPKVRIDVLSSALMSLIKSLPQEKKEYLEVHELGPILDLYV
ncbi:hypothetical protein A2V71_01515 [Candidatus Berkelbacteria bacterium RBG_13_40_8]|uniref:N-acetyltransferase domain-containing protein n=1 Tax=Candidatus Berkelbacteria bacterium RBG_13_40_8 TaxID=1797467 RepID=A0A1F5DP40_9BACT|nr:MAG: hypothetical protein A2V71_01515 [Candidatus Berkelbacteria bacterium RBG_13_40_8]